MSASTSKVYEEIPERQALDEQHIFTTQTLGFLIHPNIPTTTPNLKVADIGTGTGVWLLDVATSLPPTAQLTGFDLTSSAFPPASSVPSNVSFQIQDMHLPFPDAELASYDVVAVRFVSSATTRSEWRQTLENVMTLLKPGGWLQWIDSCNFSMYNSVPGTSRRACQEIFDALEPFRKKQDVVIGMMMREAGNVRREEVWRDVGLLEVHEDVFSSDKLQDASLQLRDKLTRNAIICFTGCLGGLVDDETSGWTKEKIEALEKKAMEEIDKGAYHTIDQVCMVGKKA